MLCTHDYDRLKVYGRSKALDYLKRELSDTGCPPEKMNQENQPEGIGRVERYHLLLICEQTMEISLADY